MAQIAKKTKRYPSDLTDEEWERIAPLMPTPRRRGRPREVDFREVINVLPPSTTSSGTTLDTSKWFLQRPFGFSTLSSSNVSEQSGYLTIKGDGVGPNMSILTVGPGGTGFTESGGGYFEARIRFDGAKPSGAGSGWPSFWTMANEHLYGPATHYLETDFMEYFGGRFGGTTTHYGATAHDWTGTTSTFATKNIEGASDGNWHVFGALWTPTTLGNGTGSWKFYLDGVPEYTVTYTAGAPNSIGDSDHLPVILGTAQGWPMDVDWVHVWKPGPAQPAR
jgi:hypothetical protein